MPPMVPNFMAYQPRLPEPEAPATSAAARLLAEVPVFKAEKKSEAGQPILFLRIFNDFESTCLLVEQDAWKCCDVKILQRCKQEPCVVCREDIQVGQMCRRLPCLHLFHRECIDQWIAVKAGFLLELSSEAVTLKPVCLVFALVVLRDPAQRQHALWTT